MIYTIKFLQAGNGDCIHLYGDGHHVIVDSGEQCAELKDAVREILEADEAIDLLVISHYDSDHIKEICNILQSLTIKERKKLIKKVWFNATKVGLHGNMKEWSATDATDFGNYILEADIPWVSELKTGMRECIASGLEFEIIDGGEIYTQEETGKQLSNVKSDWNKNFAELEPYLNDKALDTSKTNRQSAIIVAHVNGHDILLPGDAIPATLAGALDQYRKDAIAHFDLVKLPHHGSYKNITQDILSKMECSDYIITTDGTEFFHPNKKMFLKVAKWGINAGDRQFMFHFNYFDDLFPKLGITDEDKRNYGFDCDGKRAFEF
jgi:beta-lactamase superfamily II metal-dependent hydrolase